MYNVPPCKHGTWRLGPARDTTRFAEAARFREGLYSLHGSAHAWMVPNGAWGETNLGLIIGDGSSVLIDTCWDPALMQEVNNHIAPAIANAPIELVINTHADGDHCWGNQLFHDKQIIGSDACIAQMKHYHPHSLSALKQAGKLLRHIPFAGIDCFGHYMSEMFAPYDFSKVRITLPTHGFQEKKLLRIGGTELVLFNVGPGHTDGDSLVYIPREQVVYAGDILFADCTPVMWSGPVTNLIRALETLRHLDANVIVPGHGRLATNHDVTAAIHYWQFAQDHLYRCYQQSMTPFDAARSILHSPQFLSSPFAHWDSPERLLTNAYALYCEWGARLPQLPEKLNVMNILRQQAMLAFSLPSATPKIMRHPLRWAQTH